MSFSRKKYSILIIAGSMFVLEVYQLFPNFILLKIFATTFNLLGALYILKFFQFEKLKKKEGIYHFLIVMMPLILFIHMTTQSEFSALDIYGRAIIFSFIFLVFSTALVPPEKNKIKSRSR